MFVLRFRHRSCAWVLMVTIAWPWARLALLTTQWSKPACQGDRRRRRRRRKWRWAGGGWRESKSLDFPAVQYAWLKLRRTQMGYAMLIWRKFLAFGGTITVTSPTWSKWSRRPSLRLRGASLTSLQVTLVPLLAPLLLEGQHSLTPVPISLVSLHSLLLLQGQRSLDILPTTSSLLQLSLSWSASWQTGCVKWRGVFSVFVQILKLGFNSLVGWWESE